MKKGGFMKGKLGVSCLAVLTAIVLAFTACGGGGGGGSSSSPDPINDLLNELDGQGSGTSSNGDTPTYSITVEKAVGGLVGASVANKKLTQVNAGDTVIINAYPNVEPV